MKGLMAEVLKPLFAVVTVVGLSVGGGSFTASTAAPQGPAPSLTVDQENAKLHAEVMLLRRALVDKERASLEAKASSPQEVGSQARRRRWSPPTDNITKAQVQWARSLENYDVLARQYSDEQIIVYYAPYYIRSVEGDVLPEDLKPIKDTINPPYNAYPNCNGASCRQARR